MTAQELRDKRGRLITEARALLDSVKDGALSTEDAAKYDRILADADGIKKQLERMDRLEVEERAIVPESQRQAPKATDAHVDLPAPTSFEARRRAAARTDEYRKAYAQYLRSGRDGMDHTELRALQVGVDTEGGYLAPDEYERSLIQALEMPVIMRRPGMATITSGVSGDKTLPIVSSHGSASWTTEEASFTESDEVFSKIELHAYKLATMIRVSEELASDSVFDLESYIRGEFARRFGKAEDTAFITGNGINRPTGVSTRSTLGVTAAAVGAVTADELINLKFSLGMQYRPRARWIMADTTLRDISKLKDGNGQYLWQPGLQANVADRLLGAEVMTSEDMPAMATGVKSILWGDYSYYRICDRAGVFFQVLRERYADTGQIGYRAYMRTDGNLTLTTTVYHLIQA